MQVMEQFHIVAELYDGLSAIRYIKEQASLISPLSMFASLV